MTDYHGQEYIEGKAPQDVPEAPEQPQTQQVRMRPFARVQFKGRYGFGCSNFQEFEKRDLTLKQAREIAWDFFGVCGKTITCFDQKGNVVHEE